MNDDRFDSAPGDRIGLLVPLAVALAVLATLALALLGRTWVNSRTTAVTVSGPLQILNGDLARQADGWTPAGPATLVWVPDHGGSLAITSSTSAAPAGAAAPPGPLVVGKVRDGATYRLSAKVRLARPTVRDVRLAVIGCVGGATNSASSRDLAPRLRTSAWTTVSLDTRLVVGSCTTGLPTVQITALGKGRILLVDDVSLARL
jgi:hypothetical protein